MLDAAVGVLDVLTDDINIHRHARPAEHGVHARQALEVAEVGKGAERLAERDIDRFAPAADRRAHRALVEQPGALDRLDRLVGHAAAVAGGKDPLAHLHGDELDLFLHARGFEHAEARVHDLGADAISGGEGDLDLLRHVGDSCVVGV